MVAIVEMVMVAEEAVVSMVTCDGVNVSRVTQRPPALAAGAPRRSPSALYCGQK